jgi:hypothetical protein
MNRLGPTGVVVAKIIPSNIKSLVESRCFELLDEWRYLNRSRAENGKFMDQLVAHRDVGKKLQDFIDTAATRKYIKDVIVNKYAKKKRVMPREIETVLKSVTNDDLEEIDWVEDDHLSLHRTNQGALVVTARTTFVKWETGLRKILLYVNLKPVLRDPAQNVIKVLAVFEHSSDVNETDRTELRSALDMIGIRVVWGT